MAAARACPDAGITTIRVLGDGRDLAQGAGGISALRPAPSTVSLAGWRLTDLVQVLGSGTK
jgi:hypothetical protein